MNFKREKGEEKKKKKKKKKGGRKKRSDDEMDFLPPLSRSLIALKLLRLVPQ